MARPIGEWTHATEPIGPVIAWISADPEAEPIIVGVAPSLRDAHIAASILDSLDVVPALDQEVRANG